MRPSRLPGYAWAAPMTAVGLLAAGAAAVTGGTVRRRGGVVEASGGCLRILLRGGAAMALGHVILARDGTCLRRSRLHEMHHVRQFERWGPLTLPVYGIVAVWLRLRGRHPYLDHPMEPPPTDPTA